MTKSAKKIDTKRKSKRDEKLPFGKENFLIIGAGVVVIIVGYLALAKGPIEGFLPLFLAPMLLVLGYCVIIPLGILFRKSYLKVDQSGSSQTAS